MDIRSLIVKALRKKYEADIEQAKTTANIYLERPVGKIREALKWYPYHGNLCADVINHANSIGRKLENDIKEIIQNI